MRKAKNLLKLRNLYWLALLPLLAWALREAPLEAALSTLRSLRPEAVLALWALNTGLLVSFSARWWLILRSQGYRPPYRSLVAYRLASFGVAYFTPGPQCGGEPLQVLLLHRRERVPAATAAASVGLDKALELAANFTFLLVGAGAILLGGFMAVSARFQVLSLALGLLALPCGYLGALWSGRQPLSWLLARLSPWPAAPAILRKGLQTLPEAERQAAQFFRARPGTITLALGLSLATWILIVLEYWLALRFLGLQLDLPQTIVLLTVARLAFMLPAPAGLGALEAGQVLAMGILGLPPAYGLSLSLLIRARDVTFGLAGLWLGGLMLRGAGRAPLPAQAGD